MCEENLLIGQLVLGELGDWIGRSGGQADHPTVGGGDGEGEVGVGGVHVLGPQLRVGDGHGGSGPDYEAGVVDQPRLRVVHGVDQDLEDEGDGGLVLVRPVQTLGPCHQHHLVLHGIASVMNVLKYFLEISTNIFVNYK